MSRILAFEADRRTINITLNSFGTELSKEQRARLFPTIGRLFPEGNNALARAEDVDSVKVAVEHIAEYKAFFDAAEKGLTTHADDNGIDLAAGAGDAEGTSLEDEFYKHEMRINLGSFLQQFQYSVFYSFIRLKEQEIRNLVWVSLPRRGCLFCVCADFWTDRLQSVLCKITRRGSTTISSSIRVCTVCLLSPRRIELSYMFMFHSQILPTPGDGIAETHLVSSLLLNPSIGYCKQRVEQCSCGCATECVREEETIGWYLLSWSLELCILLCYRASSSSESKVGLLTLSASESCPTRNCSGESEQRV